MRGRLDLLDDVGDDAILIYDKRVAGDAHVFFPIHRFFHPAAVSLDRFLFWVAEQREREIIFLRESLVLLDAICADAKHSRTGFFNLFPGVSQAARLRRTAGRVVFRVEIEDDVFPSVVSKRMLLAVLVR